MSSGTIARASERLRRLTDAELRRRIEWADATMAEWDSRNAVVEVAAQLVAGLAELSMLRTALERHQAARRRLADAGRARP